MYQHLLVPIDDSELSVANVGEAVRLAGSFTTPAKITFFHATPDYGASVEGSRAKASMQDRLHRVPLFSEGTAIRVPELTPEEFRERVIGSSRALLARSADSSGTFILAACFTVSFVASRLPSQIVSRWVSDAVRSASIR